MSDSNEPQPLKSVLDETFGESGSPEIEKLALQVIDEHGMGLQLGVAEWRQVQALVEQGILAGMRCQSSQ